MHRNDGQRFLNKHYCSLLVVAMACYMQIAVTPFFFTVKAEQIVVVIGNEGGNCSSVRLYPPAMRSKNRDA